MPLAGNRVFLSARPKQAGALPYIIQTKNPVKKPLLSKNIFLLFSLQ
jgi:hypothetical protein